MVRILNRNVLKLLWKEDSSQNQHCATYHHSLPLRSCYYHFGCRGATIAALMADEHALLLKKLDPEREESIIHQGQHDRFDDVEQRVEKLEEIHPHGHHTSA